MTAEQVRDEIKSGDIDFGVFGAWWRVHEAGRWASTMRYFVLFLVYPGVSKMVFEGFSCRTINNEVVVLRKDTRIDCESGTYVALLIGSWGMLLVFVVGVPTMWLMDLLRYKLGW